MQTKKLILTISLFVGFGAFCQELKIDSLTNHYTQVTVIELPGIGKKEIYSKVLKWISLNYNTSEVVDFKDEESGQVVVKGNFETNTYMKPGFIHHTFVIEIKDNKIRCTFTDLSYYSPGSGEIPLEKVMMSKKRLVEESQGNINGSISSISSFIKKKEVESSGW